MRVFQPIFTLKGKLSQNDAGSFPVRKGLVVTQFTISQLLIIGTVVIANQMRYAAQADMGFNKDAIVMLALPDNEKAKISTLYSQLSQITGVKETTVCNAAPASENVPTTGIRFDSRTEDEKFSIAVKAGDHRYVLHLGCRSWKDRTSILRMPSASFCSMKWRSKNLV